MKKLVLTLLMSCVVGTVSASEIEATTGKEKALWALQTAGKRVVPAVVGYMAASAVKERVGSYGFMAFFGLAALPFVLDSKKVESYQAFNPTLKTVLNSFGAGVAAREAVSLVPVAAKRLAALRGR